MVAAPGGKAAATRPMRAASRAPLPASTSRRPSVASASATACNCPRAIPDAAPRCPCERRCKVPRRDPRAAERAAVPDSMGRRRLRRGSIRATRPAADRANSRVSARPVHRAHRMGEKRPEAAAGETGPDRNPGCVEQRRSRRELGVHIDGHLVAERPHLRHRAPTHLAIPADLGEPAAPGPFSLKWSTR